MRIIAGSAKGRRLMAPPEGTRPMTGKARESVFSILGHRLVDADVLDLFAGSGGLGLESLSRGARSAVFVERSRRAARVIRDNIEAVGLGGELVIMDVSEALRKLYRRFDVVFVDPPYVLPDDEVGSILAALDRVVAPDGIVILHRRARSVLHPVDFLVCIDERRYGDAVVYLLERPPS
jgi:16S rRNA (guanine966-N2)-methyltransferase